MDGVALSAPVHQIDLSPAGLSARGVYRGTIMTLIVACVTVLLFASSDLPSESPRIWYAAATVMVCGIPIIAFAARPERWYVLLPLIALAYLVGFGIPSFTAEFPLPIHLDPMP